MNETMNGSNKGYNPDSIPTPSSATRVFHEEGFEKLSGQVESIAEMLLKLQQSTKVDTLHLQQQVEGLKKTEAAADQLARNAMVALIASEGRSLIRDIFDMSQEAKESSAQIEGERIKERVGFLKFLVESKLPAEQLREIISALPNTEDHVFEAGHKGAQQVMKQLGAALMK